MRKVSLVLEYLLVSFMFLLLQILSATLLWNWFAPRMLGVPRANPLQIAAATLFYLVFTGKFWPDVVRLLDWRKRKPR